MHTNHPHTGRPPRYVIPHYHAPRRRLEPAGPSVTKQPPAPRSCSPSPRAAYSASVVRALRKGKEGKAKLRSNSAVAVAIQPIGHKQIVYAQPRVRCSTQCFPPECKETLWPHLLTPCTECDLTPTAPVNLRPTAPTGAPHALSPTLAQPPPPVPLSLRSHQTHGPLSPPPTSSSCALWLSGSPRKSAYTCTQQGRGGMGDSTGCEVRIR